MTIDSEAPNPQTDDRFCAAASRIYQFTFGGH